MRLILEMVAVAVGLALIRASDNPDLPWFADLACTIVGICCLWFAFADEPAPSNAERPA